MRALKRIREDPARLDGSSESLLAQFSAATLELSPSLGPDEFARRLTAHTAEMLGARAVALALENGSKWEIAALSGPAHRWERLVQYPLAAALAEQARMLPEALRAGAASSLLGRELAEGLGWRDIVLMRLSGSDGALLGALCLVDLGRDLSPTERRLLEGLASHASMALENVRLFSRVQRS